MTTAIHIELNALCLLILCVILHQSVNNVNQQMRRVLFRGIVIGVIVQLSLDILWLLVEGRTFPGAITMNRVINVLFLSASVILGCMWYLYVLEELGFNVTRKIEILVMLPAVYAIAINTASYWTEWTFSVSAENIYAHGDQFWLQMIGAYGMLLVSLIHIIVRLIDRRDTVPRRTVFKLLGFYAVPFIGAIVSLFYTGMPGAWTCAAISIVIIYIDDQDGEILRDSLTGLNNRKTLNAVFTEYAKQGQPLYLFMMDLDRFKQINDTYGHPAGDAALVTAARLLSDAMVGQKGILARYGGDEFLIMAFMDGDRKAEGFKSALQARFDAYTREHDLPYPLAISAGCARYRGGDTLTSFVERADQALYEDKKRRKQARKELKS